MNDNAAIAIVFATMFTSCAACGVGDDYARSQRMGSIEITCPSGMVVKITSEGSDDLRAKNVCRDEAANPNTSKPRRRS